MKKFVHFFYFPAPDELGQLSWSLSGLQPDADSERLQMLNSGMATPPSGSSGHSWG